MSAPTHTIRSVTAHYSLKLTYKSNFFFGFVLSSILWQRCACTLFRLRHRNHLVRKKTTYWLKNSCFGHHTHGWRCPKNIPFLLPQSWLVFVTKVLLKIHDFVTTNAAEDILNSHQKYPDLFTIKMAGDISRSASPWLEIVQSFAKNTRFCHGKYDRSCPDFFSHQKHGVTLTPCFL